MSCPGGRCYDYLNIKIPVLLLSIRTARMCVAQHALGLCLSIGGLYKVTRLASLRPSYCLSRARTGTASSAVRRGAVVWALTARAQLQAPSLDCGPRRTPAHAAPFLPVRRGS